MRLAHSIRRRALVAATTALLLAGGLAGTAQAQWQPPDERDRLAPRIDRTTRGGRRDTAAPTGDPDAHWLDISLSAGSWWWFSHFRAETSNDRFEITGPTTFDTHLSVVWPVWKQLELDLSPEFAMGSGTQTWVVGVGVAYRLDAFDAWWWMLRGRLRTRLAFLAGGFDWDDAPGSFDTGFGAEIGAEFAFGVSWLPDAMAITAGVDLRSLTFDFDPDPNVVDTDSAYGGFGMLLRFGVRYGF